MPTKSHKPGLTLTLALLGAGLAWLAARRVPGGRPTWPSLPAAGPSTDRSLSPDIGAEAAAGSPNTAERLQATRGLGVGAGIGQSLPTAEPQPRIFDTQNAEGDQIVPGLPDQFRGA